jgi:DNA invertase Pin-like site-specific DNA recombinase
LETHPQTLATETDARLIVVYTRVSTERQDLERQRAQIERAQAENPGREPRVIEDDGVSAYRVPIFERPGGRELCELIEAGRVEKVYTDAQDRLSRGHDLEWITFRTLAATHDTALLIDGRELRDDLGGKIEGYLKALLARQESEEKSHRVSTGKEAASRAGYWPHGRAPLGYVTVAAADNPSRKVLTPSADAETVREAFRLADEERASLRDIVRFLSKATGHAYDRTFANALLENPTYTGKVKCAGKLYDGRHAALVSEERFERIQRRLVAQAEAHTRPPKKWPFAGILRCGTCGSTLRFRIRKHRYTYLECNGAQALPRKCFQEALPAALFEANFAFHVGAIAHALRLRLTDPSFAVAADGASDLGAARQRLSEARDRLETAGELVLDGALRRDDPRYQHAKGEKEAAEATVQRLSATARSYRDELQSLVANVEEFSAVRAELERWIEREPVAHTQAGVELLGARFVHRVIAGWDSADLHAKRRLVERLFSRIDATADSLTLHFHTALPCPLPIPALFDATGPDRADVEAAGFGNLAAADALPLTGTAPM